MRRGTAARLALAVLAATAALVVAQASRVALSSDRSGGLRVRIRGRGLDLSGANRPAITTVLGFGPDQFESTNVFRSIGARLRYP